MLSKFCIIFIYKNDLKRSVYKKIFNDSEDIECLTITASALLLVCHMRLPGSRYNHTVSLMSNFQTSYCRQNVPNLICR